MERGDTVFRKPFFPVLGNWLGERPLEAHQLLPINLKFLGLNSIALHSSRPVNGFRSADKNLFRVASPERACPAERPRIDDCHQPSCRTPPRLHPKVDQSCSPNTTT